MGRFKNVPRIVMVTAFGREDVRAQAEEIGIDGYLLKPVNASVLYDTLMDLFGAVEADGRRARFAKRRRAPMTRTGSASCWWKTTR